MERGFTGEGSVKVIVEAPLNRGRVESRGGARPLVAHLGVGSGCAEDMSAPASSPPACASTVPSISMARGRGGGGSTEH